MDLVGALTGGAKHFMFSWLPELGTRYHVVDLGENPSSSPSSKKPLPVAPFFDHRDPNFFFHVVNAFVDEAKHEFVFDVPAHEDASMLDVLSLDNLRSNARAVTRSRLTRVRVPLPAAGKEEGGKSVRVERLFADSSDLDSIEPFFFEFPSPNPRKKGSDYRFAWGLSAVMPTSAGNALAKVAIRGGEKVKTWFEPGCLPGEPLMVPRPRKENEEEEGDPKEDDGVVLSLVVGADGESFLLILDAETMEEVARARLGAGLPYGFHCCWVEKEEEGDF